MARFVLAMVAMLAFVPFSPAHAQDKLNCSNMDSLPQMAMNQCASIAWQEADAELNAVWGELRDVRGGNQEWQAILAAQRLWIPFRDAHCEATAAPYEGGSIQPLIRFSCLTDTTRQRTTQLREFLNEF
jgi:uncharacterized protein YecT (DUF1311 family)